MAKKRFSEFYELVSNKKEALDRANYVLIPIKKYNKKVKRVLELGVGIGLVLRCFPKRFELYGLDIKKDFIKICKKKIPRGKFYVSSMHNFKINKKFDVVFSVFDSVNFLTSFNQWISTFETVDKHLNKNGLFIFDMYTPKILEKFRDKKATKSKFSKGFMSVKAIIKGNSLTWDFKIFEKLKSGKYELHQYYFKEKIHSVEKVKKVLSKQFKILEMKKLDKDTRILFVCRKRG